MADFLDCESERPEVPAVRAIHHRFDFETLASIAQKKVSDPHMARLVAIFICHAYSGAKLAEIGGYFNLSESGVSKVCSRLKRNMESDQKLRIMVNDIVSALGKGNVKL